MAPCLPAAVSRLLAQQPGRLAPRPTRRSHLPRLAHSIATTCAASKAAQAASKASQAHQIISDASPPHPSLPPFTQRAIEKTQHPNPSWTYGAGAPSSPSEHREIDPYASDRPMIANYRLLISGIAPRPIGLISTLTATSKNLSPFSYFQLIDHDPPVFVVGFSSRPGREKDTFRNLKETKQCVINSVSENMIEAVNASSIDAPYGVSEWQVSGLTEAPSSTVKPSRVQESVLSIEAEVVDVKEFESPADGMSVAGLVMLRATRFWVREDATNDDASHIDLDKLRPVGQLGGKSYGRILSAFELPRRRWADEVPKSELLAKLDESAKSD